MVLTAILAAETAAAAEAPNPILPETVELVVGGIAFIIVFLIVWKFAFPPLQKMLTARTEKIQGDLEKAEGTRREAEAELDRYRQQLAGAREETNRIIDEARRTADQLRRDLSARAEQESQATVARAQEEIRAERDRVFQELKAQVAEISVELAGRVIGQALDKKAHDKLIDEYIAQVSGSGNGEKA